MHGQKAYNKFSVFFGEAATQVPVTRDNVVRVYIDEHGFYYPEWPIEDRSLKKQKDGLRRWYEKHPEQLAQICAQYQVDSSLALLEKILVLNEAIIAKKTALINQKMTWNTEVNILIHGFRKKAYGDIGKYSSYSIKDNEGLRKRLSRGSPGRLFVEIYWDSKFITGILAAIGRKPFKIFEQSAIPNAKNVGRALRKLVSGIESEKINLFSHSLGAIVAAELLFNSQASDVPTPGQKQINACFIAPAIGSEAFQNYDKRPGREQAHDNYNIFIIYNENDYVLEKTYRWKKFKKSFLPTRFGNTSLGCNWDDDIKKLQDIFKTFNAADRLSVYDCSWISEQRPMRCHHINCYGRHPLFETVLEIISNY